MSNKIRTIFPARQGDGDAEVVFAPSPLSATTENITLLEALAAVAGWKAGTMQLIGLHRIGIALADEVDRLSGELAASDARREQQALLIKETVKQVLGFAGHVQQAEANANRLQRLETVCQEIYDWLQRKNLHQTEHGRVLAEALEIFTEARDDYPGKDDAA
jgi:hypothetical protein